MKTKFESEKMKKKISCSINFLGRHIDLAARNALWKMGLDYKHGTGKN